MSQQTILNVQHSKCSHQLHTLKLSSIAQFDSGSVDLLTCLFLLIHLALHSHFPMMPQITVNFN